MQNQEQGKNGSEQSSPPLVLERGRILPSSSISPERDEFAEFKAKGLNFRPFLRMLQRNILLIAGINIAVAFGVTASSLKAPRSFAGSFRILVEPITGDARLTDPTVISRDGSGGTSSLDYPTLLQVLQSPALLSKITQQIQAKVPTFPANGLDGQIVVQRLGTSVLDSAKIIDIKYVGGDPETVKIVLEELAQGYLNYSLEDRKLRIGGGVKFIEDQLPALRQRVGNLENALQGLQQQYRLSDPSTEGAKLMDQAKEVETQKLDTQRDLQEQIALYNNLQKQLKLTPDEAIPAADLSGEPRYQTLLTQLKTIESQIAVKSARFSEDSPVIQALRDQEQNLKNLLNQEAQNILGQSPDPRVTNPQVKVFQNSIRMNLIGKLVENVNEVKVLEVRKQAVLQNQAVLEQRLQMFPEISRRYNDTKRQLDLATKTLDQLLIQRETLRVEAAQKEVPWQMVSNPDVQRGPGGKPMPVARETGKVLAVGLVLGLVLGLIAAIIRDKLNEVFHTSEDIQDITDMPLFGVIPFNRDNQHISAQQENNSNISGFNNVQASLFEEAFNALYASLCFLSGDMPVRSLVISSAAPGEGKTTVALHLAQVAAMLGRRVLLVDANLLTPQIHTRLGLSNAHGLADMLTKNLLLDDVIQTSDRQDNLFVLTSGNVTSGSGRRLASTQMQDLMAKLYAAFDLVIYDTPHLLGLSDTNFLAAESDGLLMVVGVGKTKRSAVMQVLSGLKEFQLPVLGMIANHVTRRGRTSFGYRYRYYQSNPKGRSPFSRKLQGLNARFLLAVNKNSSL